MSTQVCSIIVTTNKQVCSPTQSLCSLGSVQQSLIVSFDNTKCSLIITHCNLWSNKYKQRSQRLADKLSLLSQSCISSRHRFLLIRQRHSLRWVFAVLGGLFNCALHFCTEIFVLSSLRTLRLAVSHQPIDRAPANPSNVWVRSFFRGKIQEQAVLTGTFFSCVDLSC